MRPLRTFSVEPALPQPLEPLLELAYNMWWCWHGEALELFRRLDASLWEEVYHNPVAMLGRVEQSRLEEMAQRGAEVAAEMNRPEVASNGALMVKLAREHGRLEKFLKPFREYRRATDQLNESIGILRTRVPTMS